MSQNNSGLLMKPYILRKNKNSILYEKIDEQKIDYKNVLFIVIAFLIFQVGVIFFVIILLIIFHGKHFNKTQEPDNFSPEKLYELLLLRFLAFKNSHNQQVYGHIINDYEKDLKNGASKLKKKNFSKNEKISSKSNNTMFEYEKENKTSIPKKNDNQTSYSLPKDKSEPKSIWDGYTSALDEFKK